MNYHHSHVFSEEKFNLQTLNTHMKPYNLINSKIVEKEKGILNKTFTRFVGPGDSIFSMFFRSMGYRITIPLEELHSIDFEFVIYDNNEKNIELFKRILTWDGQINSEATSEFDDDWEIFIKTIIQDLDIKIRDFHHGQTIGRSKRRGFIDFQATWNHFKNSKFTFINIDVVNENRKFLDILTNLPPMSDPANRQFIKLDFNKTGYDKESYNDAINNVLHLFWLKSFKQFQTVLEISDDNNQPFEDFAGKLYARLNPTFCILPWMHIQYKPSGQSKLCCRYDNIKEIKEFEEFEKTSISKENLSQLYREKENLVIQKISMEDSFNSNYWNTARQYTIENKEISGCQKCYNEEQVAGELSTSMRTGSSILYNQGYLHKKPKYEKPKITFLEVGFGNYCNLACLSCNSTLSTTWHDDEVKLNNMSDKSLQRVIFPKLDNIRFEPNEETLKTLELIKFTGGEPMINPEFIRFIDLICEKGTPENISLEIYTNCSYVPSPKLLKNLIRFNTVQLNLSIDAYGTVNDYVRYGSHWFGDSKQTVSNALDFWLEQGKNNKNIHVIMSSTLSVLTVFDVPNLMTRWVEKYKNSGNDIVVDMNTNHDGFFKLQLAVDPSYINMNILPSEYYKDILEWCDEYDQSFTTRYPEFSVIPESINASLVKLRNTIYRCSGNPTNARLLIEYLEKMDSIRGNSASESIPVMLGKVKEYLLTQDKPQQN